LWRKGGGEGVGGQFLLSFFLSFGTSPRGNHKNTTNRAVAMCFVTEGHYHECPRHEPCCFEPQKIFKFGGSETLFSALVIDCKTVRIFAYSSTREQSNKRSGTRLKTERDWGETLKVRHFSFESQRSQNNVVTKSIIISVLW